MKLVLPTFNFHNSHIEGVTLSSCKNHVKLPSWHPHSRNVDVMLCGHFSLLGTYLHLSNI